jgi:hypothetical protein
MIDVEMIRIAYLPYATFSVLRVNTFECYVIERPWKNNKVVESCIPCGVYRIKRGHFNLGEYATYEFVDVGGGRTLIKFHRGNKATDSKGCPILGYELGEDDDMLILKYGTSTEAHNDFMLAMGNVKDARCTVKNSSEVLIWPQQI